MGKLKDQLKKLEQNTRHAIKKVDVRLTLSPHREAAQGALESAEKELTEMNTILATANGIEADIKTRLEGLPLAAAEGDQKLIGEKVNIIRSGVQKLSETQVKVAAEKQIASAERGKVSSIPNEVENSEHAEEQAKDACSKALSSATTIKSMLEQARNDLRTIQAAQQAITVLLDQERKLANDQPQLAPSPQAVQPVIPVAQPSAVAPPPYHPDDGEGFVLVAAPETQNARLAELTRQRQAIEQAINAELAAGGGHGQNAPGPAITMLRNAGEQNPQAQPPQNNVQAAAIRTRLAS